MAQFYNNNISEQETIINFDYEERQVFVYTCNKRVYDRLNKKIGKPHKVYYTKEKISGASWVIPFANKKTITQVLSRPTLAGSMT